MKRYYLRFRIMLMTFALGLASIGFFNLLTKYLNEISVNLPKVESDSPIFVFPRERKKMPYGGGSPCCDSNNYSNKSVNDSKKIQK